VLLQVHFVIPAVFLQALRRSKDLRDRRRADGLHRGYSARGAAGRATGGRPYTKLRGLYGWGVHLCRSFGYIQAPQEKKNSRKNQLL
jgi:hypothetical protein